MKLSQLDLATYNLHGENFPFNVFIFQRDENEAKGGKSISIRTKMLRVAPTPSQPTHTHTHTHTHTQVHIKLDKKYIKYVIRCSKMFCIEFMITSKNEVLKCWYNMWTIIKGWDICNKSWLFSINRNLLDSVICEC